ncbi:hypothetical protein EK21DRAFT_91805 [Setomelanomma holmii]|uniref:Uncharacterized protein n=1 Tax=Setomelanomma holmii TaxID=210430 RepID=A0A9P4LK05_9PLEO|nr:hypothetical protein EK21DRAFT_91805 [Setomelanomma holmii]
MDPVQRFSQCLCGARLAAFQRRVLKCDHACAGCSNGRCRGTLTGPMAERAMGSQRAEGAQSGGQVWNRAAVVRGRGPCNRGGIPGAHRAHTVMVDSQLLPRRAAHAAGGEGLWDGEVAEAAATGGQAVTGGASTRARQERHSSRATPWDRAWGEGGRRAGGRAAMEKNTGARNGGSGSGNGGRHGQRRAFYCGGRWQSVASRR